MLPVQSRGWVVARKVIRYGWRSYGPQGRISSPLRIPVADVLERRIWGT